MKYRAWAFLILCNLFWAGNMIFGKYSASDFPAVWIALLRWAIAVVILVPMAHFIEKPAWLRVWKDNWKIILLLSVTGVVIYNILTYSALRYTSSTNGALINTLTPAMIMLFSLIFMKVKLSGMKIAGMVVSFLGVLTVLTKGNLLQVFHTAYNKGDALMIVVILFWTVYSLLSKKAKHIPSITMIAMTAIVGVILMIPLLFTQPLDVSRITPLGITGIIYLGLFPSVGSFIFWNQGMKMLGPNTAGMTMNLIPIFTAIIAVFLGQQLVASQFIGGLLVIGGMILTAGLFKWRPRARHVSAVPSSSKS
ncbi:DMT family transporter [Paenibacillus sp. R14(2021)]|uniref:DMT family transporter n=1 Tax=Paenibacillus sp. R14(2021) TaxID=2859228 RepID=UPI001C6122B8|nr:DMT family transporter [Paenibacillus sp. R14(2021)]